MEPIKLSADEAALVDAEEIIRDTANIALGRNYECPICQARIDGKPLLHDGIVYDRGNETDCVVNRAIAWCIATDGVWLLDPKLEAEFEQRICKDIPKPLGVRIFPRDVITEMIAEGLIRNEYPALRILELWAARGKYEWGVSIDLGWMTEPTARNK